MLYDTCLTGTSLAVFLQFIPTVTGTLVTAESVGTVMMTRAVTIIISTHHVCMIGAITLVNIYSNSGCYDCMYTCSCM